MFCAAPVGVLPELVGAALGKPQARHRGHRRRLDQARPSTRWRNSTVERFIGGHPLAGAETAGVDGSREDLFEGARWYLTPTPTRGPALRSAARAVAGLGARPQAVDAASHDREMATVSHLPHVLANVLADQAARSGRRGPSG